MVVSLTDPTATLRVDCYHRTMRRPHVHIGGFILPCAALAIPGHTWASGKDAHWFRLEDKERLSGGMRASEL